MSEESQKAHDVLAAEEFVVPAPDPQLAEREAHDVLAAEEFGVPAPDPVLRIGGAPIPMPPNPKDPDNSAPPSDVLAAEEFAMPGQVPRAIPPGFTPVPTSRRADGLRVGAVFMAAGLVIARTLRRRRRSRAA